MAETIIDEKTDTDSSPVSDEKQTTATDSSTVATDQKAPQTIADVVKDVVAQHDKEAAPEADTAADEKSGSKIEPDEDEADESESEDAPTTKTEEDDEEQGKEGPVPYNRFKEVTQQKADLDTRLKELEPLVQQQQRTEQYCRENGITGEDFGEALSLVALSKQDPMAFYKRLTEMAEQFAPMVGARLSADLQKDVDDGVITLAYAQRLQKAEAEKNISLNKSKKSAEQVQAEREQARVREISATSTSWEAAKTKLDPDMVPKKGVDEPDGKYEVFADKVRVLAQSMPLGTSAQVVALLEKAYADTNKLFSRFTPKAKANGKVLSSSRSSGQPAAGKPKSIRDVAMAIGREHGIGT